MEPSWERKTTPIPETYCWWFRNPAAVEVGSWSHYLQGFSTIPGGWPWDFRTINSKSQPIPGMPFNLEPTPCPQKSFHLYQQICTTRTKQRDGPGDFVQKVVRMKHLRVVIFYAPPNFFTPKMLCSSFFRHGIQRVWPFAFLSKFVLQHLATCHDHLALQDLQVSTCPLACGKISSTRMDSNHSCEFNKLGSSLSGTCVAMVMTKGSLAVTCWCPKGGGLPKDDEHVGAPWGCKLWQFFEEHGFFSTHTSSLPII